MQGHFALHGQTLTFATPVFVMAHFPLSTIIGIGVTLWGYWFGVLGAGRWRNRTFDPHLRRTKQGQTLGEVEFVQVIGKNFWLDGGNVVEITFPPVT
ncbi:hypothetical protein [Yersinia kristensenii]|uniref:hypothetical protein n=1 Tax=Yersinia kristensenii TaxID=28152 RepID=UPI0005E92937|nr:hypothetical protein [Yersinia kristensenii]CNE04689.1 benzoate transport protein [Yersinia kristensenii]